MTAAEAHVPVYRLTTFAQVRDLEAILAVLERTAIIVAPPIPLLGVGPRYASYYRGVRLPGRSWCQPAWRTLGEAQMALAETFALAMAVEGRKN